MSESINIEKPDITVLSNILSDNTVYTIPPFQRDYSWTEQNCRELFYDVINGYRRKKPLFIGIFMYYNEGAITGNKRENVLIDGQQRLTTLMLILCAIRDVDPDKRLKCSINNFIQNSNRKLNKFKLKQNNYDDLNFQYILSQKKDECSKKSLIYINYNKIVEMVRNSLKGRNKIKLSGLFEYIKRLESVEIVLKKDDINNVQTIFEKINSTGISLKAPDLVRNFVLFDKENQQELYKKWVCMEKIIGSKRLLSKFIRAYTIRYAYKVVNQDEVYTTFRSIFENSPKEKIMNNMLKYSIYFSIIKNHLYCEYDNDFEVIKSEEGSSYDDTTLKLLNELGSDDVIPLILQLYDKKYDCDKTTLGEQLNLLLDFMIRYRIAKQSGGGGSLDNKLYGIIKKIDKNQCKLTFNGLYNELSKSDTDASAYPGNTRFIDYMRRGMDQNHGRVLLFQYARRKKTEITYTFSKNVSLEHLMPQTITSGTKDGDWWIKNIGKKQFNTVYDNYLNCVGNYGLLSKSINTKASNSKWPEKRKIILANALDEKTIEAANSLTWKKTDIDNRNKEFSKELAKYITGPKSEYKKSYKWLYKKS